VVDVSGVPTPVAQFGAPRDASDAAGTNEGARPISARDDWCVLGSSSLGVPRRGGGRLNS